MIRNGSGVPEQRWPVIQETQSHKEGFQANEGRWRSSPLSFQSYSVADGGIFSTGVFLILLVLGMNLY